VTAAPADDDGPSLDADGKPLPREDGRAAGVHIKVNVALTPGGTRGTENEESQP
jgi:hypothetical protein